MQDISTSTDLQDLGVAVPTPTVATVVVKLLAFWTANLVAWFAQAKAQFSLRHIQAEETRYWYVISALDSSTSALSAFIHGAQKLPADHLWPV